MKIFNTLIVMTAVVIMGAFSIAQALAQPTTSPTLTLGTISNGANGVFLQPQASPLLRNAKIVNDCDLDDSDTLHSINQYKTVAIEQIDKCQSFGFTYVYVNKADQNNTCTVTGSFQANGAIDSLTATHSGTGFTCSISSGSMQKVGTSKPSVVYLVDFH